VKNNLAKNQQKTVHAQNMRKQTGTHGFYPFLNPKPNGIR
jgi:hypothetical protein